jgi:hypothetical protein
MGHLDSVCRPDITDNEAGASVDDDGAEPANLGIVERDFVVGEAPDSHGRPTQRIRAAAGLAEPGES